MKNVLLLLLISIAFFSCKKEAKQGTITLHFEHTVGNDFLEFDNQKYQSPTGHPYQITKMLYYVSNIRFVMTNGTEVAKNNGFLINPSEDNGSDVFLNDIKPGKYNKAILQFGFDKTNNVESYLTSTLENQNMFWPSTLGPGAYHYMKFEGKYDSLDMGIEKNFKYHFGPTSGNDNSFKIELNIEEFEVDDNSFHIYIKADLQEWLLNPTAYNFPDYNMVMGNQSFQEIYKANGKTVFSFKQLTQDAE